MTIRFVPRDRCNALSNTTNKTNDTKTSLIVVKPTTTLNIKQKRERNKHFEFSLSRERTRIQNLIKRVPLKPSTDLSHSLSFGTSSTPSSLTLPPRTLLSRSTCSLLFYGDDARRVLSRAQKRMFKISNSLSDLR
jgi:hypothetical protein